MSGTLAFRYFPSQTWRPSGVNIEFDPSQANTAMQNLRALLVGQILAGGTTPPNVPVLAYSTAQVNLLCGANSMLALEYAAYRAMDPNGEVWLGPLSDAGGGVAATGSLAITGPATAAGTIALYLMGVAVPVAVTAGDAATVIAGNVAAAINAMAGIAVSAVTVSASVNLTALHKGLALNDIDIRLNYIGPQAGEVLPAGVGVGITAMSGGTTNPVLTTLLTNLGVQAFDFVALPYTDTTSMNALQSFLSDSSGRWSATQMQFGHVFAAFNGTLSARTTFGVGRNDQHASVLGYYNSPTPAWIECADWCAANAIRLKVNPAQGLATQPLNLLPPPVASRDPVGQRNILLFDGISTFTVDPSGTCRIDRSITTYQLNAAGQPDNSYLNTNILFQAMYAARYISSQVSSQFIAAGKILVSNGTPIGPGSPATTPNAILVTTLLAWLTRWTLGARRGISLAVIGQSNGVNGYNAGAWHLMAQGVAWYLGALAGNVAGAPYSTLIGGLGIYPIPSGDPGYGLNGTFIVSPGDGSNPSGWALDTASGAMGVACQSYFAGLSAADLADIAAIYWPWNETDSTRQYSEKATLYAAEQRAISLTRGFIGKAASVLPWLTWNALTFPYGNDPGMNAIREIEYDLTQLAGENAAIALTNVIDVNPMGATINSDGTTTGGDYSHVNLPDLPKLGFRGAALAAKAILASSGGDTITAFPSGVVSAGGPRISHVYQQSVTQYVLTIIHDTGNDLIVPQQAVYGVGFALMDGGTVASPGSQIFASACARVDATRLLVTFPSAPSNPASSCLFFYPYGGNRTGSGNAVTDNASTISAPAGWDIGNQLGSDWNVNYPLAATTYGLAISTSPT